MNTKDNKIEYLWVMGGASVLKSRNTSDIVGYLCYCEECKKKSVNGDGGIAFNTAEDLLSHRKMKAFECPGGCGFHICEEFGSITRHLDAYHKEMLVKLQKEGLDMSSRKRVWIYPDYSNNTYTLTKPMPAFDASPLENAGSIIAGVFVSIPPPKQVEVPPSPVPPSPVPVNNKKGKGRFVPLNLNDVATPVATRPHSSINSTKNWNKPENKGISFSKIMADEKELSMTTIAEELVVKHYAPKDMRKEEQCPYGKACVKRDRPFACALNHDGKGDIIKCGTELTEDILCSYERPPYRRCGDGRCTKIHLEHRAEFIEQKKQQFFKTDASGNSYSSVAGKSKRENEYATAIINTSSKGTTMMLSHKDVSAVADILSHLKINSDESENSSTASSSASEDDDEDEDEDDEDLSDNSTFASRFYMTSGANQ